MSGVAESLRAKAQADLEQVEKRAGELRAVLAWFDLVEEPKAKPEPKPAPRPTPPPAMFAKVTKAIEAVKAKPVASKPKGPDGKRRKVDEPLTRRIIKMRSDGFSYGEITKTLKISPRTVSRALKGVAR